MENQRKDLARYQKAGNHIPTRERCYQRLKKMDMLYSHLNYADETKKIYLTVKEIVWYAGRIEGKRVEFYFRLME